MGNSQKTNPKGFTIIELLVVVVVIGILAAVSIVSYGAITQKAEESRLKQVLVNASNKIELSRVEKGTYPDNTTLDEYITQLSSDTTAPFNYHQRINGEGFCADIYSLKFPSMQFYVDEDNLNAKQGRCDESMPLVTEASCFGSRTVDGGVAINSYSNSCPKRVAIPQEIGGRSVVRIDAQVFRGKELIAVSFPSTLRTIGGDSFRSNLLTSVHIPDSVLEIEQFAFNANQLQAVRLPSSLRRLGFHSFSQNKLTTVNIPASLKIIEDNVFNNNALSSVVIPESIEDIGSAAFFNNKLTTVQLPDSVQTVHSAAFMNNSISSLRLSKNLTAIEGYVFRNNQIETIDLPSGITSIGMDAFFANRIRSITIPPNVGSVGVNAFYGNPNTVCRVSSPQPTGLTEARCSSVQVY